MKPWMTCEGEYQSERCCEFSELITTPCQSFTMPQVQIGVAPHEQQDQRGERDDAEGEGEVIRRTSGVELGLPPQRISCRHART